MMGLLSRRRATSVLSSTLLIAISARGVAAHDHDMDGIEEGKHISAEPIVRGEDIEEIGQRVDN
jgi:hypothetical protein